MLGFTLGMEAFDEPLLINVPGVRSSLVFLGFGLKIPASGFQSYFYSSLKTSPSPFEENGHFSGCLMSSAGIQKLFCGIYSAFKCSFDEFGGEKVVSPSYSSAILGLPPRQHIKKQRHYFANKGPSCQSYGFSSSHVWM